MKPSLLGWIALGLLGLAPSAFADRKAAIDVVVDMSPEGRKVPPPTAQSPAYYLPILGGYKELGQIYANEPAPPKPAEIAHLVAVALAKQNYYVVRFEKALVTDASGKKTEQSIVDRRYPPSLILAIHWGSMNPENDNLGGDPGDASQNVFFNQAQMLALVGGNTVDNLDMDFEREDVMQAANEDRYFVVVSAYDFHSYADHRKKVLLWQAKMSVPGDGVTLARVLPALITAGGPLFGRETKRPKMLLANLGPEGQVEIGTPTVLDYQDAPTPPAPSGSAAAPEQPPANPNK